MRTPSCWYVIFVDVCTFKTPDICKPTRFHKSLFLAGRPLHKEKHWLQFWTDLLLQIK